MMIPNLGGIDRADHMPPFEQIARILRTAITDGAWPPDTRIPTETQLAEHFGVARMTVRSAIKLLHTENLLRAGPGRGHYTKPSPSRPGTAGGPVRITFQAPDGSPIAIRCSTNKDGTVALHLTVPTHVTVDIAHNADPLQS